MGPDHRKILCWLPRDYLTLIRTKAKTACLWSHNTEPSFLEFFGGEGVVFKTLLHEMHAIVFFLSFKNYSFTFDNLLLFIMYLTTFTLHCLFLSHPSPWPLILSSKYTLLLSWFFSKKSIYVFDHIHPPLPFLIPPLSLTSDPVFQIHFPTSTIF